jgi:hypothetical protein
LTVPVHSFLPGTVKMSFSEIELVTTQNQLTLHTRYCVFGSQTLWNRRVNDLNQGLRRGVLEDDHSGSSQQLLASVAQLSTHPQSLKEEHLCAE